MRWLWIAGVAVMVIAVAIHRWRQPSPSQRLRARLEADAHHPFRAWVQAVFLLVTSDCDYGHLGRSEGRRMLVHWWQIYGPVQHRRTLEELAMSPYADNAWDLVRFILVSRLGVAAGYTDDATSWVEILPVARRLQRAYPSWRAMAQAYVVARRQWRGLALDGSEDDNSMRGIIDNLVELDETRWANLDFHARLELETGPEQEEPSGTR